MRRAKSYSIIDHAVWHRGYFQKLNHSSLVLYLFFVVVGDRDGKSYYSEESIARILRLTEEDLQRSLEALSELGLIHYRRPYCTVRELTEERQQSYCSSSNRSAGPVLERDSPSTTMPTSVLDYAGSSDNKNSILAIREIIQKLQPGYQSVDQKKALLDPTIHKGKEKSWRS